MGDNTLVFFVACVMPIVIFLISIISTMNRDKLRTKVLIKAIETNADMDTEKLAEALQKPKKTPLEVLNSRLLYGCIFTMIGVFCGFVFMLFGEMNDSSGIVSFLFTAACLAIGLGFLVTYFVTRKQVSLIDQNKNQKEKVYKS